MKKSLLLSALSLMASSLMAAPAATQLRGERPLAPAYLTPGAKLQIEQLRTPTPDKALMRIQARQAERSAMVAKAKAQAEKAATAHRPAGARPAPATTNPTNALRIGGTALDAAPRLAFENRDTILVTSYDYIVDDLTENLATIEYDEYGYRTYLTRDNETTRYTYTIDGDGRWTSRTVERGDKNSDSWEPVSKQERTIDDGRVTSITLYGVTDEYSEATGSWVPSLYKQEYYEIEYRQGESMQIYDGTSSTEIDNAGITHHISYYSDGSVNEENRYLYIEQMGYYVTTYYLSDWCKKESEPGDGYIAITTYYRNYDNGDWRKSDTETIYYGNIVGTVYTYYNDSGDVEYCYGYGTERYSEGDDIVEIYYDYDDDLNAFVLDDKQVHSANYDENHDYDRDFEWWCAYYDYSDGEWQFNYSNRYAFKLLSNGIGQVTQTTCDGYYGEYSETYYVMPQKVYNEYYDNGYYWELYDVTLDKDGSYIVTKGYYDNDSYGYIYEYYSADGTLLREIKQEGSYDVGFSFMVREAGSDTWTALEEYTVTEEEDGDTYRIVYRTGSDGRPASITYYVTSPSYNGGNEFKYEEVIYTYQANGDYTIETYEVYDPRDITKMTLTEKDELVTLADGSKQYTSLEYDEDGTGEIDYGSRRIVNGYIITYYSYDTSSNEWKYSWATCEDEIYTTDDGITVTIQRELADDGTTAVYRSKWENKQEETTLPDGVVRSYSYSANYEWDTDRSDWRGSYRNESTSYEAAFPYDYASSFNPIYAYNDEYTVAPTSDDVYYSSRYVSADCGWWWNDETWAWVPNSNEQCTVAMSIDGDTLTTSEITHREDEESVEDREETVKITRDSELRQIGEEHINSSSSTYYGETSSWVEHYRDTYTYNEQCGMLAEQKTERFDENGQIASTEIYRFTYTPFTIKASGIEECLKDADAVLTIEGGEAVAVGRAISVYNAGGILVASGRDRVALPAANGVYIVRAAGTAVKVAVR